MIDFEIPPDVPRIPDDWDVSTSPDYHPVVSIQLCELANDGFFDLTREDWDFGPKYSPEQHAQLCRKITDHYWYREIALVPPGIWKHEFLRKLNEIMPKYMIRYKNADSGVELGTESEYYKSRNIFSEFPQTALQGNSQDYASTGNDVEYEKIRQMDPIELAERLRSYDDVDLAIIIELESMFSCLFTVNVNGY
jgi:hypothetical protein